MPNEYVNLFLTKILLNVPDWFAEPKGQSLLKLAWKD